MTRTGRPPLKNSKNHDLRVRIDSETYANLQAYCEKSGELKAEIIRKALIEYLGKAKQS